MATNNTLLHPHAVTADPEESYALPGAYYTDPAIFELEKETIFSKNWVFACHAEKVREPGSYTTVDIVDQNILITRSKDDNKLRAFYNVCPHRGHELAQGDGKKSIISCPYHAWTFRLDGELNSARGTDKVKDFDKKEHCLKSVSVEEYATLIFVNLDPNAKPMSEVYKGFDEDIRSYIPDLDKLTFSHRIQYEVKANWKVIVDNYLECNHCGPAHKDLCDVIDMKQYKSLIYENYSSHITPMLKADNSAYKINESNIGNDKFVGYFMWPNLLFNGNPGETSMNIFHLKPIGPDLTIEYFDFYFLDKEPTEEGWAEIKYYDETLNPEDIGLCESVQRGLKSKGYSSAGRLVVDAERTGSISEHSLNHFHNLYLKNLKG